MTILALATLLHQIGLPVAYRVWQTPPVLPYLIYYVEDSNNYAADNKTYAKSLNCIVELYSDKKSLQHEQQVENVFDANDLYYEKTESWIEDEQLHMIAYSINI